VICLAAAWVLRRTPFGAWIYATGGNTDSARRAGVPTSRVKLILFVATAAASALCGVIQTAEFNSGNAASGQGFVFQAPIVAVIGGILLTGGYGSVIGATLGTITYGIVNIGLFYTGWSTDWTTAIVGILLVLAVIGNHAIHKLALTRGPDRPRKEPTR
jgi:simple sugar transport system permease protein